MAIDLPDGVSCRYRRPVSVEPSGKAAPDGGVNAYPAYEPRHLAILYPVAHLNELA